MQWRIGDVTITKVLEMEATGGSRFLLPQATPEVIKGIAWLQPHFADENGRLKMSIHSFLVETPGGMRMIVDTCLGNDKENRKIPHWNNRTGPFLEDLAKAGFPPSRSIPCSARTCMSITSAGTRSWSTASGCRPSATRDT